MDRRIYHGDINPEYIAQALVAEFDQGNTRTQVLGTPDNLTIQIASSGYVRSGGRTAIAINVQKVEDGVMVQVGNQQWLGVAASLGQTAISTLINPINLLGRLDDIAQDVSSLQMTEKIWQVIASASHSIGVGQELSERLTTLACDYCGSANPVGVSNCISCGAPLGNIQPRSCVNCGFVLFHDEKVCPNCGKAT